MTTHSNNDEEEKIIKRTDPLRSKKPAPSENEPPQGTGAAKIDPLQELRENLYSEAHPQENAKNDIFKRMTESLSSRKSAQKSKDMNGAEHVFGVRTAGSAPFEPADRQEPETDWSRDTVILQNAPKSDAFVPDWPKTRSAGESEDQDSSAYNSGQEDFRTPAESKVRPMDPNEQDGIWENYSREEAIVHKPQVISQDEKAAPVQGERKRLPSGFDRQQQVSRYISYNPKRSTWDQFQDLPQVEKILIIALAVAVVGVFSLIVYLFIQSRQPGFGLGNRAAVELTPSVTVSPPIPAGLVLPGGWSFKLGAGIMVDGEWNPQKSEWLMGTEIRRVVALPWNKQLEAVVHTFEPGDLITLEMNNGDSFAYKVVTVSEVAVEDTSILYDIHPTLAIVLNNPDAKNRWVVVAEPN